MYNLPEISEPAQQLERLVRKERDAQIQRRYHMLLLMKTGEVESRTGAGRHLGVHRNTIADWLELYEEGGLDGLREIGEPGPRTDRSFRPAVDPLRRNGGLERTPLRAGGIR
ncbi:helix-turn-helix domain-containing protein [Salinibacter ruber]|uniref:helix-turn-helix domain-containing protein n=1 Tax=Salinibacter ruber TaxID=146919 RepID=UPI003C6E4735